MITTTTIPYHKEILLQNLYVFCNLCKFTTSNDTDQFSSDKKYTIVVVLANRIWKTNHETILKMMKDVKYRWHMTMYNTII